MQIQDITFQQVLFVFALFVLILEIYIKISNARKAYREEKKSKEQPVNSLENMVNEHEQKLARDYKRLNELEEAIRILMRSQIAQLDHEISGNSLEKLRDSKDEIQKFLIEK